jgi:O-antigen ligase
MALSAAAVYYCEKPVFKLLALTVLGLAGYCMILTLSRGAWLGMIFAAVVFALVNDRRLVWAGLILILLSPVIVPQNIMERLMSIGNVTDTSTNYRVFIWMASLNMAGFFWPSGIGLGEQTFIQMYSMYSYNAVWTPHSHNLFLQITIVLGALGIFTLLLMFAVMLKRMIITARSADDKFSRILSGAAAAAVLGFLLQGMTDNVWYNYRVTCYSWLILAVGMAAAHWKNGGDNIEKV